MDMPQMDPSQFDTDHAMLKHYRERYPVARSPLGFPMALHYRLLETMLDPQKTRQLELETMNLQGITEGPLRNLFENMLLFSNGETHTRRRTPVARTFAFKLMEGMRGEVRDISEAVIRTRLGGEPFDFVQDFAGEIPARIIARLLGIPETETSRFRDLVYSVVRGLGIHNPAIRPEVERDLQALSDFVEELFAQRRAAPRDDFLSAYLRQTESTGDLSPDEIRSQIIALIGGGADTTRIAICSLLSQLLQHRNQWRDLCDDPEGLKMAAVSEGLRFDPSAASFPRVALVDLDFDGISVPKGSFIVFSMLSAMRDPAIYDQPDEFNIHRTDHPRWHPVFGGGAHRCLGEALARVELEEMINAIVRLAPGTIMVGEPPRITGLAAVRFIDRMEICFRD